jgi:hypothetical protein
MDDLRALRFKPFERHIALPRAKRRVSGGIKKSRRVIFRSAPRRMLIADLEK